MKKWSDSMGEIRFEGKASLMREIERLDCQKMSLAERWTSFLEREVSIPVPAAISTALIVILLFSAGFDFNEQTTYAYSITVVDRWGQYETY